MEHDLLDRAVAAISTVFKKKGSGIKPTGEEEKPSRQIHYIIDSFGDDFCGPGSISVSSEKDGEIKPTGEEEKPSRQIHYTIDSFGDDFCGPRYPKRKIS